METTTRETIPDAKPIPPVCYGSGERKAYFSANVFEWYRVSPKECFSCPFERRCLAQQRRMRRR